TKVSAAKATAKGVTLDLQPAAGGTIEPLQADYVLVAIGRRPCTAGLGLETVGLATDKRGMLENQQHRSRVPGIWIIGDVTSGPMLAHKAEDEAIACIERIAGHAAEVNYEAIPGVIYTKPELATVGKTEEQLKAEGRAYKVGKFPCTANSRAKINHEAEGFVKVLADERTDQILGVHIIGPSAGELIGEYCVALEFSASAEDIALICHPHPTRSEALRQAAMNVHGWAMQV
ncbi:MAG: FAD-dependent oxidoreductase, partial [Pseudomonas sp.]|nr:FAD-dependent oxidoreductase [Pseudomonas sp.]